jgi:hypothetical protein
MVINHDDKFSKDDLSFSHEFGSGGYLSSDEYTQEFKNRFNIIESPNTGLMGYNFGLEAGRIFDCPVLLCNDDTVFGQDWYDELVAIPNLCVKHLNVYHEGVEKACKSSTIGVIAPCYVNPGCMKHQKLDPNKEGYTAVDFCVGHAQVITKAAVRAGFKFEPSICEKFGPYDVYQSMWMQQHDFNILIAQECCFDFPNSTESHYHEGAPEKFGNLNAPWGKMELKLMKEYQPLHIAKHGFNKWYFE